MLQQTQVKTVIPYWERWVKLFPNVQALASASEDAVLKAWEGLGYYSRARNLQKAARMICQDHNGVFPRSHAEVLELPGIGPYTAGAICSIAFNDPAPILDGNVARVLARVFAVNGSVKARPTQIVLWDLSSQLVSATDRCGRLNEGLMELGALICVPVSPSCGSCPLQKQCAAFQSDRVGDFPSRTESPAMREREFVAFVIEHRNRVLVRKRADGLVNGGLWEFPNIEVTGASREEILREHDLAFTPLTAIRHTITRNRITLRAFSSQANGNARTLSRRFEAEWRPISELQDLAFSSAHGKLRSLVQSSRSSK